MNIFTKRARYSKSCLTNIHCVIRKYTANGVASGGQGEVGEEGEWPRRVLTGLQPTGVLHLGNYLGAVQACVRLQEQGAELSVCVADLHALTTQRDAAVLRSSVLDTAACLLAAGLRPDRTTLFVQSAVPRHADLCWVLTCLVSYPRVAALPQFREKGGATARLGLLAYPVLQAADVLLHRATHVPVGADQLQHLQLAAHLARAFRRHYGRAPFPEPRPLLPDDASVRVKSLRDPTKKMSKSDLDSKSKILLSDSDDEIRLKIRKAVTDFTPEVSYDPERRPGVSNLVALHCLCAGVEPAAAVAGARGLTTAQYKEQVAAAVVAAVAPVRARAAALRADEAGLRAVLRAGAQTAAATADHTYTDVANTVGLIHR